MSEKLLATGSAQETSVTIEEMFETVSTSETDSQFLSDYQVLEGFINQSDRPVRIDDMLGLLDYSGDKEAERNRLRACLIHSFNSGRIQRLEKGVYAKLEFNKGSYTSIYLHQQILDLLTLAVSQLITNRFILI